MPFITISYVSCLIKSLPRNLEYVIAETHKCFPILQLGFPILQLAIYSTLYQSMNDGKTSLKISMNCKTR